MNDIAYVITTTYRDGNGARKGRTRFCTASKERAEQARTNDPDQTIEVVHLSNLRPKERENILRARKEEEWKAKLRL